MYCLNYGGSVMVLKQKKESIFLKKIKSKATRKEEKEYAKAVFFSSVTQIAILCVVIFFCYL